ncbi:unnamed protein product, partial [Musa textilis]
GKDSEQTYGPARKDKKPWRPMDSSCWSLSFANGVLDKDWFRHRSRHDDEEDFHLCERYEVPFFRISVSIF